MEDEILACIKFDDIKYLHSGQVSKYVFPVKRGEAHHKKFNHLITRFFIMSENSSGEIMYLVQKRGKLKTSYPEYFTDSSSGHVLWSRNLNLKQIKKNALRELEEEFGIPPNEVKKIKFYDLFVEEDEAAYVFFGLVDNDIKLIPDPQELNIKESKFYNRTDLERILNKENNIESTKRIWKILIEKDSSNLFNEKFKSVKSVGKDVALMIGRFQPLHHGHLYVLRNILKSYKKVKIGIGSSQLSNTKNDPFTSEERKKFLKAALEKRNISSDNYEIYEIPDIFNAKKWINHVISIVGEFNSVYSNSSWVRELFLIQGIKVEKKQYLFKKKYNGNNIRSLVRKNNRTWRNLVPKEVVSLIEEFNGIKRIQFEKGKDDL
jgi:nicotinamide-nucleotide adenylyltransferase